MFSVDDLIVYGGTGVCRVESISEVDFIEDDDLYYVLRPLYKNGTIYAPVESDKVFMRNIMSAEEALQLIDSMPDVRSEVYKSNSIQQLSKHYQAIIDTHQSVDLIRLMKSLHMKELESAKQNRHLGQIDRKFMKRAEDLLFGELAAALGVEREDIVDFVDRRIAEQQN